MEVNMPQTDGTMRKMADLTNESESDMVTVVCGENTYFIPLNKLIDNSQFFAKALDVPMVEKKERKVVIKDLEEVIFEKVIKYITEGKFKFNMETEAFEALEAADRLDMKKLKEEVCDRIKDNLDSENVKAVLSLAERFSTKQLFKAAFYFMQLRSIKLEKEDIVANPNLALAFMEECRVKLEALTEELTAKEQELTAREQELDVKDDLLKYYRMNALNDSFDYDEEDWQVYDSLEEVEDEHEEGNNLEEVEDEHEKGNNLEEVEDEHEEGNNLEEVEIELEEGELLPLGEEKVAEWNEDEQGGEGGNEKDRGD